LAPQSHGVHLTDGLQKPPTCNPVESGKTGLTTQENECEKRKKPVKEEACTRKKPVQGRKEEACTRKKPVQGRSLYPKGLAQTMT
jgi:hypothetical protein